MNADEHRFNIQSLPPANQRSPAFIGG